MPRRAFRILVVLLAAVAPLVAEPYAVGDFRADNTTAEARAAFRVTERDEKLLARLATPLDEPGAEKLWGDAFWTAGLLNERGPEVRAAIETALARFADLSPEFRNVVLRSVHTLYPGEYTAAVRQTLPLLDHPRAFATAAAHLLAHDASAETRLAITRAMVQNFPDWRADGRLAFLWHELETGTRPERPALEPLLDHDWRGKAVVFSFQRRDRRHPGRVALRRADGTFHRDADGALVTIGQLAMSRTNLPGTITFGNTPQGLFTIPTRGVARNVHIGPTPYLYSKVPFEATVAEFLHDPAATAPWSLDLYTSLLPEAWRAYWPVHEAWHAGAVGRSEMLCHGTTIDPDFSVGEPYWPYTPSAGCLTTEEWWNADGTLRTSGQVELLNAFLEAGDGTGYLLVVELDAAPRAVTHAEIVRLIGDR